MCNIPIGFAPTSFSCGKPIGFVHFSGLFSSSYCFPWQAQHFFQSWMRSHQMCFSFLSVLLVGTATCGMWDMSPNAHRSWEHAPGHEVFKEGDALLPHPCVKTVNRVSVSGVSTPVWRLSQARDDSQKARQLQPPFLGGKGSASVWTWSLQWLLASGSEKSLWHILYIRVDAALHFLILEPFCFA